MDVSFNELKYLVSSVAEDLLKDDFGNLLDGFSGCGDSKLVGFSDVSDEVYDKIHLLSSLLVELYKHRPLPF